MAEPDASISKCITKEEEKKCFQAIQIRNDLLFLF